MYWKHDEKKNLFVCEQGEKYEIKLPDDGDGCRCGECWRQCAFARFGKDVAHVFRAGTGKK